MKRIICLVLVFVMLVPLCVPAWAEENESGYEIVTMEVEYSDNVGNLEELTFMMNDGNLYVSARELATRLGYDEVLVKEKGVYITKKTNQEPPYGTTVLFFDNTKVMHTISKNMGLELFEDYEAPFCSIKNGDDAWIPFRYALFVLGSAVAVIDGTYCIDIPELTISDIFYLVTKNSGRYRFDWYDDFGYSDFNIETMGVSSHIVNVVNGLIKFDGDSWAEFFQIHATDVSAYDRKYGENLAVLFCTQSDKELNAEIKRVKQMTDFINPKGKLGSLLSKGSEMFDQKVGTMQESCDKLFAMAEAGNTSWAEYNKAYQALEKALNRQSWYEDATELITETQKGLKGTVPYLKALTTAMEVVSYAEEFQRQDDFSIAALKASLENLGEEDYSAKVMKPSMLSYIKRLESDILTYSAAQWFKKNVSKFIKNATGISKAMGSPAGVVLAAWDLVSSYVPQIKASLDATDKFQLALYSTVFCSDVYRRYLDLKSEVFSKKKMITPENLYKVSQACYTYLKTCLITRDAALASITSTSDYKAGKLNQLFEQQNGINEEISELLIILKDGNLTNENYVYGFLPSDNKKFLASYDDSDLIAVFEEEAMQASEPTEEQMRIMEKAVNPLINGFGRYELQDGILYTEDLRDSDLVHLLSYHILKTHDSDLPDFETVFKDGRVFANRETAIQYINDLYGKQLDADTVKEHLGPWDIITETEIGKSQADGDSITVSQFETCKVEGNQLIVSLSYEIMYVVEELNTSGMVEAVFAADSDSFWGYHLVSLQMEEDTVVTRKENTEEQESSQMSAESQNSSVYTEEEIYEKLVKYYEEGNEEEGLVVMPGTVSGSIYSTVVRCGVPGNAGASQTLYEINADMLTGEVTQIRVLTDNQVKTFNLN